MIENKCSIPEKRKLLAQRIYSAALSRQLDMSADRTDTLVAYYGYQKETDKLNEQSGIGTYYAYNRDGLKISKPMLASAGGMKPSWSGIIDFLPAVGDDYIPAQAHAQRGKTSEISLLGLRMFQDYVLLADAGLIEKPETLYGKTNSSMARFAVRVGFESTPMQDGSICAPFETVADHLFSAEAIRVEKLLEQRLGKAALVW